MATEIYNLIINIVSRGGKITDAELKSLNKTLGTLETTTGKTGSQLGVFGSILKYRVVSEIINFTGEAWEMAGTLDSARVGFHNLTESMTGQTNILKQLRDATRGTVSEIDLMTKANLALGLGIPADQLVHMFEIATKLGPVMGRTTLQAIDDLTRGLGRQSTKILDNIGIRLRANEAYEIYADRIGKSTQALTDQEKILAFATIGLERADEIVARTGDDVSDMTIAVQSAGAVWKNFTGFVATGIGVWAMLGKSIGDTAWNLRNFLQLRTWEETGQFNVELENMRMNMDNVEHSVTILNDSVQGTWQWWVDYGDAIHGANKELRDYIDGVDAARGAGSYAPSTPGTGIDEETRKLNDEIRLADEAVSLYRKELGWLNAANNAGALSTEEYNSTLEKLENTLYYAELRADSLRLSLEGVNNEMLEYLMGLPTGVYGGEDIWWSPQWHKDDKGRYRYKHDDKTGESIRDYNPPPLAAGGIVTSPTLALIGESGPEAVIPLNNERGVMGDTNIHIHIGTLMGTDERSARKFSRLLARMSATELERRGIKL